MKIALIGASGFVGKHYLDEALKRGHHVTAIVRKTDGVEQKHPNVTVKQGDVYDQHQVAQLVSEHDVVLSAFNSGWTNPLIYEDFLRGARAIQAGTKSAGVKRLLFTGGAGSLEIAPGLQLV